MPENPGVVQVQPPQMIQSLAGGFNAVANNLHLILLPVIFDLILWFGPHIRIKKLLENSIFNLIDLMRSLSPLEMSSFWQQTQSTAVLFLEQYNLLSQLSTFPVGIPSLLGLQSLLNGRAPVNTPCGSAAYDD